MKITLSSLYIISILNTFEFTPLWFVYIFRFFWRLPWLMPYDERIEIGFKPFSLIGSMVSMIMIFGITTEDFSIGVKILTPLQALAIFDMIVFSIAVMVVITFYIRMQIHHHSRGGNAQRLRRLRGLRGIRERDQARREMEMSTINRAIQTLRTFTFVPEIDRSGWAQEFAECVVCRAEFEEGDTLCNLTCGHVDHLDCLTSWFKGGMTSAHCPRCRKSIITTSDGVDEVSEVN